MSNNYKTKIPEEQVQNLLADYMVTKDMKLRDKIVLQYKNLVESIARRFTGSGEPLEDLAQEGYIGLITAADLYDAGKGVKFSTYATHFIIGQIKHALRDRGKIIKEPAWLQELNHRITRVVDALYQELNRQPTELEIANVMHISEEMVADLLTTREVFKVTSLDNDQDDSSSLCLDIDKVKDDKYVVFQLPVEDKVVLETAMNKLKIIEQKVIQDFYYTGLTQTEIAKKLGISCNYVSHILRTGTKKLRRILATEEIMEAQMQLQLASRRSEEVEAGMNSIVIDNLTGLYNREYIADRLGEELTRAARNKTEVAFAVITIHGAEDFAKRYGTMRHDDALCALARAIKDSVRKCDIVGCLDEGQFALILPHTGDRVSLVCDRVTEAIRKVEVDAGGSKPIGHFTASIGHSVYPSHAQTALGLITLAYHSDTAQIPKAA